MAPVESTDASALLEALLQLDIQELAGVIVYCLQNKTELAPCCVEACIPELTYAPATILTQKRSTGTVKSFNQAKGFGFIDCPELKPIFGKDVFVHAKQMRDLQPGTKVNFSVVLSAEREPQAFEIHEEGGGADKGGCGKALALVKAAGKGADAWSQGKGADPWGQGKGADAWGGGKSNGKDAGKSESRGMNIAMEIGQGVGTIKSFSAKSGYGFIDCQDMKDMGHGDVFLHHAQMGDFNVGDQVVFDCYLNDKGKAQAKNLMTLSAWQNGGQSYGNASTAGATAVLSAAASGGVKAGKGAKRGWADASAGASMPATRPPDREIVEELGRYSGTLKSFNEKNGYGFIECPDVKAMGYNDVFLHKAQKGDFGVGSQVLFTCFLNSKGTPAAMDLEEYSEDSEPDAKRAKTW